MRDEEKQLLGQGIKEYVDVLNAMKAFRQLVQRACRRVVVENLEDYTAALGIDLSEDRILDSEYEWSEGDFGGCSLGVKIIHKAKGIPYSELGHDLCWDRGPDGTESYLMISVWSRKKNIRQLMECMRKKKLDCDASDDGRSIWLWESISEENASSIESKLDSLMEKWIELWRKVDGLSAIAVSTE
jgi:hypothetical protein